MSSNVALLRSSGVLNLNVVECSSIFGFIDCAALGRFRGTVADGLPGSVVDATFNCCASVDGSPSSVVCLFVVDLDLGMGKE